MGDDVGFFGFPPGQTNSSGITFTHPYKGGMYRNRNRKDGTIAQRAGDTIIAGESIYAASFGTISRKALADFQKSGKELLITGIYKYCDGLGNFSSRSFDMVYDHATPGAALSFKLQGDTLVPYNGESTIDTEMLSPCETFAERQQDQEAQRNRPFAKPAKPSKTVEKTAKVR